MFHQVKNLQRVHYHQFQNHFHRRYCKSLGEGLLLLLMIGLTLNLLVSYKQQFSEGEKSVKKKLNMQYLPHPVISPVHETNYKKLNLVIYLKRGLILKAVGFSLKRSKFKISRYNTRIWEVVSHLNILAVTKKTLIYQTRIMIQLMICLVRLSCLDAKVQRSWL